MPHPLWKSREKRPLEEERKSDSSQKIHISQYAAGASVANAPPFIVNFFLNFINAEVSIIAIIVIFLSVLGGSVLGGYLMARLVRIRDYRNGGIMGCLSFAFYTLLMLLSGYINLINDLALLTAFVIGGFLGYKVWERTHNPLEFNEKAY